MSADDIRYIASLIIALIVACLMVRYSVKK